MRKFNELAVPKVSRNILAQMQTPKPEREERAGKLSSRKGRFWYCPIILLLGVLGHGTKEAEPSRTGPLRQILSGLEMMVLAWPA